MKNNKLKSLDLFAGCGGLMEGFEASDFYETLACVEWEKSPLENLENRLKEKWGYDDATRRSIRFDIRRTVELINGWSNDPEYGTSEGLDKIIGDKKLDIIIGGPPCQAYSFAGRIRDKNGMRDDYRNYLFECYNEVVKHYKPKAFIFENVPGLLSAKPNGTLIIDEIKENFSQTGYEILDNLRNAVIDFSEYGVPQNRSRVIILGLSKDVYPNAQEMLKRFYSEILPKYKVKSKQSVKQAISDLPKWFPLDSENKQELTHFSSEPIFPNHIPRRQNKRDIGIFKLLTKDIDEGKNEFISADSLKKLYTDMTGKSSNVHKYHVIQWDKTSNLIPAHLYKDGLRHIHPDSEQARTITVREAARLQSFDDDFIFIGSQADQYKMIGNAVPPKFSKILAKAVTELLFK